MKELRTARGHSRTLALASALVAQGDGIAFDALGNLLVAVNGHAKGHRGSLVLVTPGGSVSTLAADPRWLDYPTQPVFVGPGLYVLNGSLDAGAPNIVHWPTVPF